MQAMPRRCHQQLVGRRAKVSPSRTLYWMPGGAGFAQRSTPQAATAARIRRARPLSGRTSRRRARSGFDDLGVVDAGVSTGIASIDDEWAVRDDEAIIDAVMIGADERRIRFAKRRRR